MPPKVNRNHRKNNPFANNTNIVETGNPVTNPGNVTIIPWNIRGFQSNKNLLLATIQDSHPEITMLQETLTKNVHPPKRPGYIVYNKPRIINSPTVGREITTAVRADVPHIPTPNTYQIKTDKL